MLGSVYARRIWERRPAYAGWAGGLLALVVITVAFWPSIEQETDALGQLFESLPRGFVAIFGAEDIAELFTAAGFVNSRMYSSVGAIIMVFFAISMGTGAVAGEEDTGTLDLLLALPVRRHAVVLQGFLAMATMTAGLGAGVFLVLVIADPLVDLGLPVIGLVAANVGVTLLALVFGTLALAVGSLTGRRSLAIGAAAGATFATFFINGLAPLVDQIAWTQKLTPFYWFLDSRPLETGFGWAFLLLVAAIVLFLALAVWGFERRDVAV